MNEVTRVHLGRQPFTISVEAHKVLKAYLSDIQKQVADGEVANEVELRMSELLTERGIAGDKVVLLDDVEFLKQQLGDPADFSDDDDAPVTKDADETGTKRLFRNTDSAMLAGVSAGIANYFGLDVTLVRLVFVVLAIFGGGIGIVLYIVLWLAVPPASTASEKLQMEGKSVTLSALKESVSKADLPGAAKRANRSLLPVVNKIFKLLVKLLGLGFIAAGLLMIFSLVAVKLYMALHHGKLFQENLFPVGIREQWLVTIVLSLVAIVAAFLIITGIASFKRKWPLRGWVTGVLVGLFFAGLSSALALTADIAPKVHERYEKTLHTTAVKHITAFDKVSSTGGIDVYYAYAPTYSVSIRYSGNPNLSGIKIAVKDKTLQIDSRQFDGSKHCTMACLFPKYNMTIEVAAPNIQKFAEPRDTELLYPAPTPPTPTALPETN